MKHIIWILIILSTLSGCAYLTPTTAPSPTTATASTANWTNRQALLTQLQSWQLNGKIAIQSTKDSGSASVDWLQQMNTYTISLSGPLGANNMKLEGKPGSVTLFTTDGKRYTANSPEQLLANQGGFHLPVSHLRYWVKGLPVPGMPASSRFDSNARLTSLIQQGWRVDFLEYTAVGKIELPKRISITSSTLKVKIIIYEWHLLA